MRFIDISSWQNVRNWGAVRASGVEGAIIKATGGGGYTNPSYPAQLAGARAEGLLVGHYHYGYEADVPGVGPVVEARRFFDIADILPGEPLALDIEEPKAWEGVPEWCYRFLTELERLCGFAPLLYSYKSYIIERLLHLDPRLARFALWYAYYPETAQPGAFPPAPAPWQAIELWQWSAFETIPGIGPNVDENVYAKTADDWRALGGLHASPPAPRFANPDPLTGFWVHEYFVHMYDLAGHGHPLRPAALYDDGFVRQLFERCVLESNGRGEPTVGGLGQALAFMAADRYPEWPTVKPLV